ncbi:uncharacterized protein IUM83_13035 [Phytophthora cinnamomi]|uniref:uncharacterized protein n=1 Tax=Phytophthora cinnamomi TaxID=4785 RepID=UPI003559595E|nr:hypothetical protein IUM83_13035 [Phytophthora cinnamomi]
MTYACNPTNYAADPLVCQKGDLSDKFGVFKLGKGYSVSEEWTDEHYPLPSENINTWSIVLHAVCGKEPPRISCSLGTRSGDFAEQVDQSSPGQSSPAQFTAGGYSVKVK